MIDPAHLHILQMLFARHIPHHEVLAYGSRITGGAHPGSDLDAAVRDLSDPLRPCLGLPALRSALIESPLPIAVDLCDWAALPADFRDDISARHVRIFPTDDPIARRVRI